MPYIRGFSFDCLPVGAPGIVRNWYRPRIRRSYTRKLQTTSPVILFNHSLGMSELFPSLFVREFLTATIKRSESGRFVL